MSLCLLNREFPLTIPHTWSGGQIENASPLEKLTIHCMEYLEAVDNETFAQLVEDWVDRNPPYRPGYWHDCWNSFGLSIRSVVWMQQYAVRGKQLPRQSRDILLSSVSRQIRFLCRNLETDLLGNHLIKNIKALLWAGRFFSGAEAARWSRLGQKLLKKELVDQVLPDGMHFERSPAYHAIVFADLLECYQVVEPGEIRDVLEDALDRMAHALVQLQHPDGMISLFGDGGLHMTYQPAECLNVYQRLTGRSVQPKRQIRFPQAGYFGVRRDGNYLLAKAGKIAPDFLPAHGHGDIFSFEWDIAGRRIVVDAGVYEYHVGRWREYSRSTAAHNTLTVDGEDQCEFWKAFRVGRRADVRLHQCEFDQESLVLDGQHDGYRRLPGSPVHRRRIQTDATYVEIFDRVEGGRGQQTCARLLCHPDCDVSQSDGIATISVGDIRIQLETESPMCVEEAWWLPDFGRSVKTHQIIVHYGNAPCEGGFRLTVERPALRRRIPWAACASSSK